jgi:CyaY protein
MGDQAFQALAERALERIEDAIDACGIDADLGRNGGVLTIEFDDGSKIIVNIQGPMREIWVATRSGGYHFREDSGRWLGTRGEGELFACLSRWVSEQGGQPVLLAGLSE